MEPTTAAEVPIHKKMAELRMACQREIRIRRQRSDLAFSSSQDSLRLIRLKTEQNLGNREQLAKLKDYLRKLETDLSGALTAKTCKEAKCTAIAESLSTTTARIEHLEKKVQDKRAKKVDYAAFLSQQLLDLEALEERSNEDMTEITNIEEAIMWYERFFGFRTEGGEGVKFIFNNINMKNPDEEYGFTVRLDGDTYHLTYCDPLMDNIDQLVKDLNKTNDLFRFVRIMREKFHAAALHGALPTASSVTRASSSVTVSSPPPVSVDSRSETPLKENVPHFQPTKAQQNPLQRVIHSEVAVSSPQSISTLRRSPRFAARLKEAKKTT